MPQLTIVKDYKSNLNIRETEEAIKFIKDTFQTKFAKALNLQRVSAPLFVEKGSGINDDLNGVERKSEFLLGCGKVAEGLNSLAKWKRMKLAEYGFSTGEGLYTDMNGIRLDDELDNLHSHYVDQWDWEKAINNEQRTVQFLKESVNSIYQVIKSVGEELCEKYSYINYKWPNEITHIHADDLLRKYPDLSPLEREGKASQEFGVIFVRGIGGKLSDGTIHDGRAPDYDDWSSIGSDGRIGLNGDIIVWNPILKRAYELSSMGIRVSKESLKKQLEIREASDRLNLEWHKRLLADEYPFSIGGGIGQSRLCMFYLQKAHIGETQASVWPDEMIEVCKVNGINLL
ncbi:MAG: aspartate--ammonia ligase [Pseudomonadota bacterium]